MTDTTIPVETTPTMSKGRRWASLAVLTASLLVITMDMTILNIALPEMSAELNPTSDQQLWFIDAYSLALAALLVSAAAVADRWGRKRMLVAGYAVFALASLLVLFAESAEAVIAIRALLGVGGAMIMPTTLSLIRVIFTDRRERATALSIWAAVSGLGAVIGPLVGGLLMEHFDWHAAFLINVPLMALGAVAGALLLKESRVTNPGKWDALAALLSLIGMFTLVWALKQFGKEASVAIPPAWIALAVAVAALVWFTRRSLRSEHPLLDLRLLKGRQFTAGILAAFFTMFSMIAALLLIAQWFQLVDGATPIEAGVRLMPLAVAGSIVSLAAPALSRLVGSRAVLAGGLALAGLGLVNIWFSGDGLSTVNVLVSLSLIGVGMGPLAIGSAMIMGGAPTEKAGNAGAFEETAYELGATLGVTLLGSISALVFRAQFTADPAFTALERMDPALAGQAEESFGAAAAITGELGQEALASHAAESFVQSLQTAGLIGGGIMIVVAAVVFFLTPKGTEVSNAAH